MNDRITRLLNWINGLKNRKNDEAVNLGEIEGSVIVANKNEGPSPREQRRLERKERRVTNRNIRRAKWNNLKSQGKAFLTNPVARKSYFKRQQLAKQEDLSNDLDSSFTPNYSSELQFEPVFVDLTKDAYSSTKDSPSDANSALFSDFMENLNPSVFTAEHWRSLPEDYMLRDYKDMPLSDISRFQGVENGVYKNAPLSEFQDSTYIVPVRTAKHPGITSIEYNPDFERLYPKHKHYSDSLQIIVNDACNEKYCLERDLQTAKFSSKYLPQIQKTLLKYGQDTSWIINNPERQIANQIKSYIQNKSDYKLGDDILYLNDISRHETPQLDSLRSLWFELKKFPHIWEVPVSSPELDSLTQVYNNASKTYDDWLAENPIPVVSKITYEDGTSSTWLPRFIYGKTTLGNSKGGFFINTPELLAQPNISQKLNNFINESGEPLYVAKQDDGAFSGHIHDSIPVPRIISRYLGQGYGVRPDSTNVFVIGTRTPSKKNGGILFGQEGTPLILKQNNRLNYPTYINESCTGVGPCAAWSNQQLRDIGADIYGDAWQLSGDIQSVFNGYDNISKPQIYSRRAVESTNDSASNNIKSNVGQIVSELDPNEAYAVNMYYKGSEFLNKAFNEGNDSGTHTGMLIFNNNTGKWEVVHNIHETLHIDDFENVVGSGKQYGVTHIYKTNIPDKPKRVPNFSEWVENKSPFKFKHNNITHE